MLGQMIQNFLTKRQPKEFDSSIKNLGKVTQEMAVQNHHVFSEIFDRENIPPEYYIPMIENVSFSTIISVLQTMAKDEESYKFLIEKSKKKFEQLISEFPYDQNS